MRLLKIKYNQGFTILEVAIVVLIGGILMAAFSAGLLAYVKRIQNTTTIERIQAIDDAIQKYISVNGALPCPALRDAPVDTADYGVSIDTNPGAFPDGTEKHDCVGTDIAGTTRVAGRTGYSSPAGSTYDLNIRIGVVPVRSLNLSDEYMSDAWGGRITYAVTEEMTDVERFYPNSGGISVIDGATPGNSVVQPADSAQYIIISHGHDLYGSYVSDTGNAYAESCALTSLDGENCDDDKTFRKTLSSSDTGGVNQFDDFVAIGTNIRTTELIPSGTVMAFDLSACPRGWTVYPGANKRTIVGATGVAPFTMREADGDSEVTIAVANMPAHTHVMPGDARTASYTPGSNTINYYDSTGTGVGAPQTGLAGGPGGGAPPTPLDIRNKYIALLYCRKD